MNVSLIIPAHNEEKYIGACLEAILSSGGAFSEIIVVDNASTDRTAEIAAGFPGVRVVRESEKGLTRARQRGFIESHGDSDILAYVDADTRMPAGWYGKVIDEFRNPRLACLSGPQLYYDVSAWHRFLIRLYWYVLAVPAYLALGYMVVGNNFAIRRTTLEKMHGFDTSISFYGEDTNIARRAHDFGKVKFRTDFTMPASPRRLKGQGVTRTAVLYVMNFISEAIFKAPATERYTDIR
jgi:glycosyltransferase involved in cell wall biosynthesis